MGEQATSGPDLTQGFDAAALADGKILLGHAEGETVLVTKRGDEVWRKLRWSVHSAMTEPDSCARLSP